jgi:hypothetical protein
MPKRKEVAFVQRSFLFLLLALGFPYSLSLRFSCFLGLGAFRDQRHTSLEWVTFGVWVYSSTTAFG